MNRYRQATLARLCAQDLRVRGAQTLADRAARATILLVGLGGVA